MKRLFFVLIFLTGCSTTYMQEGINIADVGSYVTIYTETTEPKYVPGNELYFAVLFTSIDGKSLRTFGWDEEFHEVLHIQPGSHEFEVTYKYATSMTGWLYANGCLSINAKQGENYIVRTKAGNNKVRFWLENLETGEITGSACEESDGQAQ